MGMRLGGGLLLLGLALIAGVFVLGGKQEEEQDGQVVDFSDDCRAEKKEAVLRFASRAEAVAYYKSRINDPDYKERAVSAERLGEIGGPEVAGVLFEAMADKSEEVRLAAARALQKLGDPAVAPRLIGALKEPNRWLPARVAEVLVSLGQACLPVLHEALADSDPAVRGYVVEILGEIGDKSSAEALHGILGDTEGNLRLKAAQALGRIANPHSVPYLIEISRDRDPKVRIQAARSLGIIGGSEAAGRLSGMLTDPDPVVRFAAREALRLTEKEG